MSKCSQRKYLFPLLRKLQYIALSFNTAGKPIPRRLHPPADCIAFYSGAENRGYLADPRQVAQERSKLAQKYGYEVHNIEEPYLREIKDPKQVFYGLESGWIVDLKDKIIYKPEKNSDIHKFYTNSTPGGDA